MPRLRALALCGPTASGKSELASQLAAEVGGEVVNADSRQMYAGMRIGTGWPTDAQFARAPHHGYGVVAPNERYSAGRYLADAHALITAIAQRGRLPIVVGGTGLYVEVLGGSMPLDRPIADDELRARIRREAEVHPQAVLRSWLESLAPHAAQRITPGDRYRTLRALEAALAARDAARDQDRGTTGTAQTAGDVQTVSLDIVVLDADPGTLRVRIAERVAAMFADGLVEEALAVRARFGAAPALSGIGYAEALAYADGAATQAEALAAATARTRSYAKRQQTWFRRLPHAVHLNAFDANNGAALRDAARELLAAT